MEKWEKLKSYNEKQIVDLQAIPMQVFFSQTLKSHPYYRETLRDQGLCMEKATKNSIRGFPYTTPEDVAQFCQGGRITRFQISPPAAGERTEPKKKSFFGKLMKGSSDPGSIDPKEYRMSQVLYAGDFSSSSIPMVFTAYDIERIKESGRRLFELWGLTRDDTMVNAFSYAPHLGFWQVFYAGLESGSTLLQSGGGRVLGTEKILTALENMKAEVLFASPLYAKHLLQAAIKFKTDIRNLTTIVLGMEPASKEITARIKELMELAGTAENRVMRSLSLTEAKTGWGECPGGGGLHTHPDLHYVEIIDPESGAVLGEKEPGEVVLTHLDARGTCLARYRTGIRTTGGITLEACSQCGTSLPRLTGDLEELKNTVTVRLPDNHEKKVNFDEIARRLDEEKTLLLWQGAVKTGDQGTSEVTINSSWFNKDDSPVAALAEELTQKYGVNTVFVPDTYSNLVNKLELETGFTAKRWVF